MDWSNPEQRKQYDSLRYQNNKAKRQAQNKIRQQSIKSAIDEYKSSRGCCKCGEKESVCLDFHHVDPNIKEIEIGNAYRQGWKLEKILEEVRKCIILCANCHRKVHANLIGV